MLLRPWDSHLLPETTAFIDRALYESLFYNEQKYLLPLRMTSSIWFNFPIFPIATPLPGVRRPNELNCSSCVISSLLKSQCWWWNFQNSANSQIPLSFSSIYFFFVLKTLKLRLTFSFAICKSNIKTVVGYFMGSPRVLGMGLEIDIVCVASFWCCRV